MRGRRRVFLAVLLSGSAAFAEVGDARVTAILRRGVELRQQGRDEAALQEFRRAFQLSPEPRVIAQVAVAEQAVGHWVAASNHIGQALAASADPWIQRNRATLEQARQEIERHVGRLLVTGGVTGAEVFVDGERVAPLPMPAVTVLAGSGVMEVRAQGFAPVSRTVRVAAGETARERVVLAPVQRAAESAPGREGGMETAARATVAGNLPGRLQIAMSGSLRFDPNDSTVNPSFTVRAGYVIADHFLLGIVAAISNENPTGHIADSGGAEVAGEWGGSTIRVQVGLQASAFGASYGREVIRDLHAQP
jgi:hypothetical protein